MRRHGPRAKLQKVTRKARHAKKLVLAHHHHAPKHPAPKVKPMKKARPVGRKRVQSQPAKIAAMHAKVRAKRVKTSRMVAGLPPAPHAAAAHRSTRATRTW